MKTVMNEFAEIIDKLVSNIVIPLLPFHVYGIFAKLLMPVPSWRSWAPSSRCSL